MAVIDPIQSEVIKRPGAKTETQGPKLEKLVRVSESLIAAATNKPPTRIGERLKKKIILGEGEQDRERNTCRNWNFHFQQGRHSGCQQP